MALRALKRPFLGDTAFVLLAPKVSARHTQPLTFPEDLLRELVCEREIGDAPDSAAVPFGNQEPNGRLACTGWQLGRDVRRVHVLFVLAKYVLLRSAQVGVARLPPGELAKELFRTLERGDLLNRLKCGGGVLVSQPRLLTTCDRK